MILQLSSITSVLAYQAQSRATPSPCQIYYLAKAMYCYNKVVFSHFNMYEHRSSGKNVIAFADAASYPINS